MSDRASFLNWMDSPLRTISAGLFLASNGLWRSRYKCSCSPVSHTALKRIQHLRKYTYHTSPTCTRRISNIRPTRTRCTYVPFPCFVHIHTSPTCTWCLSIQVPRVLGVHPHQPHVYSVHIHISPTCSRCISTPDACTVYSAHPYNSHVYLVQFIRLPLPADLLIYIWCAGWCNKGINIYLRDILTFNHSNAQYKFKIKRKTIIKNCTVSYWP